MGDRIGVQLPLREIYLSLTHHPGQLSLAIHSWVGAMSAGQRAVMLCDWGVKADMVLFAGNTVWSISERVRGVCVDALYKSTFTLLYFTLHSESTVMNDDDVWMMSLHGTGCKDNEQWCPSIPPSYCYTTDKTCCKTCRSYSIHIPGMSNLIIYLLYQWMRRARSTCRSSCTFRPTLYLKKRL